MGIESNVRIHYNNAHHTHANTETIVDHTTLATGANPAAHGMIGNLWYDREAGRTVYNIEDPNYSILTSGADVDDETEIDPTQRAATSDGRPPRLTGKARRTGVAAEAAIQSHGMFFPDVAKQLLGRVPVHRGHLARSRLPSA